MMNRLRSSREMPRQFPHTRWSLVLQATRKDSKEAADALEAVCRAYWQPLYIYVRRCGQSPHDAQDLTQEFFSRLLEKRWLDSASPEKGKLRTFLIVMLKHFMSNEWRRTSSQRRGGGQSHTSFDTAFVEGRLAVDQTNSLAPEEMFDRQWALRLLDLTIDRLRAEFSVAGKAAAFDMLKDCLMVARGSIDYAALAANLGMNEGTARVATHRMRKRFREIYREEISQTLADGADLDAEMRHLAAVLARH